MTRLLLLALLAGCSSDVRLYDNTLWQLAAGVESKHLCSCLWTFERDEAFCDEWVRVSPNIASSTVFEDEQRVRARGLGAGMTIAAFTEDPWGCEYAE